MIPYITNHNIYHIAFISLPLSSHSWGETGPFWRKASLILHSIHYRWNPGIICTNRNYVCYTWIVCIGLSLQYLWKAGARSHSVYSWGCCWPHAQWWSPSLLYTSRAKQATISSNAWEAHLSWGVLYWASQERSNDHVQWLSCVFGEITFDLPWQN